MTEPLSFRRNQPRLPVPGQPRVRAMAVVMLLCGALLVARGWLLPDHPDAAEPVVEVRGDIERPGFYTAATVHDALRAAGGSADGVANADLREGTALIVEDGGVRLAQMSESLVFGLPIDVNTASADALEAIPGIGPSLSAAILADRDQNGPFDRIEDLDRVRGIGPATLEKLQPFVSTGAQSP